MASMKRTNVERELPMLGLFSQENGDLPRRKTKGGDKVRCALVCGQSRLDAVESQESQARRENASEDQSYNRSRVLRSSRGFPGVSRAHPDTRCVAAEVLQAFRTVVVSESIH